MSSGQQLTQAVRTTPTWVAAIVAVLALVVFAPALQAQPPVVVGAEVTGTPAGGATLGLKATVQVNDGSTIQGYAWMQVEGPEVAIQNANAANTQVTLASNFATRFHLHDLLHEPPITAAQLPPNVPLPPGEFQGGLPDRFQIVALNHFVLEEAGLVAIRLTVTTTSGTYAHRVEIHMPVMWRQNPGIYNVPIGEPVLFHGKHQDSYNWTLMAPTGSNANLLGGSSGLPFFTPDVAGIYHVSVTDLDTNTPVEMTVYAGTWRGIIVGQDANGRPVTDGICLACHSGGLIGNQFAPWKQTGHAEIFTDQLNTGTHYGEGCFDCHTVGFNPAVKNRGVDEASDYQAFLNSGLLNNPGDNWTQVLNNFPVTAQKANIQCENCHGPAASEPGFDTLAHGWIPTVEGEPRISISSDVCGRCHGEPLRHGRYQQWQLSGHANYELAIDEGESGSCSRCHTGNGFLTWLPVLTGEVDGDPTADIEVTWNANETHPQTCVTCHDPHDIGTTTGVGSNAKVRISGNTPMLIAGFEAYGVGRGAICMTCHNSRRGLHFDGNFDEVRGTGETSRAPHGSVQADILMGENAYMVNTGVRGRHSLLTDTCVTCHMEATPPPDDLSYDQGGTNHTFYASPDICTECHNGITATGLQTAVEAMLEHLKGVIEGEMRKVMVQQINAGNRIDVGGGNMISMASQIRGIELTESRGRQAIIVTLPGGVEVGPTAMNSVMVVPPAPGTPVDLYSVAPDALPKAGWNYFLIHSDGSLGAHNPSWVLTVLDQSRDGLGNYAGPRLKDFPELSMMGARLLEQ